MFLHLPVVTLHVGVFGSVRDECVVGVLVLLILHTPLNLLLPLRGARIHMQLHILIFFPQTRNHFIGLLQRLLQLQILLFQKCKLRQRITTD